LADIVLLQESGVYLKPGVYYNTGLGTPAFGRDPAFTRRLTVLQQKGSN